jgi:hypothetical protein
LRERHSGQDGAQRSAHVTYALLRDLRRIMIASNGRKFATAEQVRAQTRERVRRYRERQRAARCGRRK